MGVVEHAGVARLYDHLECEPRRTRGPVGECESRDSNLNDGAQMRRVGRAHRVVLPQRIGEGDRTESNLQHEHPDTHPAPTTPHEQSRDSIRIPGLRRMLRRVAPPLYSPGLSQTQCLCD